LGAGAARGFAHLGVLKVLIDEKIPVHMVAGTSIGSVFGALYAVGADIKMLIDFSSQLKQNFFIDPSVSKMGLVRGRKVHALIKLLTHNKKFEDLKLPLYVVAVDIENGKKVIFESGSIADAVRASISIPGIFEPFNLGGRLYVDGAVLDRIPADVVRSKGADIVLAVDVKLSKEMSGQHKVENIFDVVFQSFDLMEKEIAKHCILDADIIIKPNVGHISAASFDRAKECIELGQEAAYRALPAIKSILNM